MVTPTLTWLLNSQREREEAPLLRAHILMEPNRPLENEDQSELRARADPPNWGFMTLVWSNRPPLQARDERIDPPIKGSYHLARPNWPLDSGILRARADPPNRGLMTLVWSNQPPLQVRARGETPQSGAHTISQGPTGPSTPVF
jgi:hypothetical protein